MSGLPILYSFRRCPYAMRARLAIMACGQLVELREVVLRDKPTAMLTASPKGTVPVLAMPDGRVLDESLDIMQWAIRTSDPEHWLDFSDVQPDLINALVAENDGPFKQALDRYKYPNRYEDIDALHERDRGAVFISKLDQMLDGQPFLFGERFTFTDAAILPFVRQFAHVDRDWFFAQDWRNVLPWLNSFLESDRFRAIMPKFDKWEADTPGVIFGQEPVA